MAVAAGVEEGAGVAEGPGRVGVALAIVVGVLLGTGVDVAGSGVGVSEAAAGVNVADGSGVSVSPSTPSWAYPRPTPREILVEIKATTNKPSRPPKYKVFFIFGVSFSNIIIHHHPSKKVGGWSVSGLLRRTGSPRSGFNKNFNVFFVFPNCK